MNPKLALFVGVALLWLGGCSLLPAAQEAKWEVPVIAAETQPARSGSLYREGASLVLFGDRKASQIGDLLTVLLVESIDASKSSSTNTQKESNVTATTPTVLGKPITKNGMPLFDSALGSSSGFSGGGESTQSNSLDGSVSVSIVGRHPNGNLLIQGRKRIELNQGSEYVSIEGIVRPEDISTNNTVNSDRIAQARIAYSGKGPLSDANRMGFIMRFFNSPWSLN